MTNTQWTLDSAEQQHGYRVWKLSAGQLRAQVTQHPAYHSVQVFGTVGTRQRHVQAEAARLYAVMLDTLGDLESAGEPAEVSLYADVRAARITCGGADALAVISGALSGCL